MHAIRCELCGANQLTRHSDGSYICDYCGTRYTLEAAKKLLIDGVVQVREADFSIAAGKLLKYHGISQDVVIPESVTIIGDKSPLAVR